jgi:hypothetical protein
VQERRYSLVYELAVANVRRFDRRAIDTREASRSDSFPQTLERALIAEYARDITEEEREEHEKLMDTCWRDDWRPSFVPDLWFVDVDSRVVHIFEIEDSSPLTPSKLKRLVDFWWAMDDEAWDVKVVVFDRYGLQPRNIDLQRVAFREMGADLNSAAYQQAIQFGRFAPDDDGPQT